MPEPSRTISVTRRSADQGLVVGEYKTLPGGGTPIVARIAAKRDLQQVVLNAFLLAVSQYKFFNTFVFVWNFSIIPTIS